MVEPRTRGTPGARVRTASVLATSTVMARTTGALFLMGGLLGVWITTLMPERPGNLAIVFAAALASVGFGIGLLIWGDRLHLLAHQLLVAVATLLITVAVAQSTSNIAALSIASFYVFIACDAAFFFSWPVAAAEIGFAVACCMTVLAARPELPWWSGLLASGATVAVGGVVGVLGRLASDADFDVLTGLLNRRGFDRALSLEIARVPRTGPRPALVLFNVDRFSAINDQHGYRAGDAALREIADSWRTLLAPKQILARYGGDEFALLLPDTTDQGAISLTERFRAAISMGCSAGVTSLQAGDSASFLVSRADVGLYRAKQAGRNRTVLESSRRPPLVVELQDAIVRETLDVHYQPIVNLAGGATTVGVEALLRWTSATQPNATPEQIVRAAEENGLIASLDKFVLTRACHDANRLQQAVPDRALILNVNVSGLELVDTDYVFRVEDVLRATGWPANQLVLEVTESVLDVDTPGATANLRDLRARGIRIAIDDFGTGYSSLSRLETLPTDYLKLDGSFVSAITAESEPPPLLQVIALLSKALGIPVIAEGVETLHQAQVLESVGFSLVQGYYYGRPQGVDALELELGKPRPTVPTQQSSRHTEPSAS